MFRKNTYVVMSLHCLEHYLYFFYFYKMIHKIYLIQKLCYVLVNDIMTQYIYFFIKIH